MYFSSETWDLGPRASLPVTSNVNLRVHDPCTKWPVAGRSK